MMLTRGRVFPCRARVAVCPLISKFMFVARVQLALLSDSGPFQSQASFRRTKVLLIDMSAGSAPRMFGKQPIMSYCPA